MSSLLSLGIQAIRANQTGLAVAGNNISNVNTPGYNRQIPNYQSVEGGGVRAEFTSRIVDDFINARLWADNSRFGAAKVYESYANQLQNFLATPSTSVSVKLDDYFSALQAANDDPTSQTSRELFVAELNSTTQRFNALHQQLASQTDNINLRITEITSEVNSLASRVADLNERIRIAKSANKDAFELQDQREQTLKELAALIDIQTLDQSNEVTVLIGNGQPLVVGQSFNPLVATRNSNDPTKIEVGIEVARRVTPLTGLIRGGELGGLIEFRDTALNRSLDDLGRLALVFADSMNRQHALGMDLEGNMGVGLFADVNSLALMKKRLLSDRLEGSVQITDASKLQSSEYELIFLAPDQFRLTRLADGRVWTQASFDQQADPQDVETEGQMYFNSVFGELRLEIDGFRLDINNNNTPFDRLETATLQPVRTGADDIKPQISSGRQLALASPLTIYPAPLNTGTGQAQISVTELSEPFRSDPRVALSGILNLDQDPLELRKTSTGYEVVGRSDLTAIVDSSDPNKILITKVDETEGKLLVHMQGVPREDDVFYIAYNFDNDPGNDKPINIGVSDNRNGLDLSDLMKKATALEGNYQQTYSRTIERMGITARVAQMDRQASETVLKNTEAQRDSLSGVNLDEEAIRLVQFQQAYQAAAQLITSSQRIFDALINAI